MAAARLALAGGSYTADKDPKLQLCVDACLPAQVSEEKEAKKVAAARLALAGGSFAADEDPFEGLNPRVCTSSALYHEAREQAYWTFVGTVQVKLLEITY